MQEDYGKQLDEHRLWLEGNLETAMNLKINAEKSLMFVMDKFTYLFTFKKQLIEEIERRDEEINNLKKILCKK